MPTATFQIGQLFASAAPAATGKRIRALCAYEGRFTSMTGSKRTFTPALLQKLADDSNAHLTSGEQVPVFYTNHDYDPKSKVGTIVGPYESREISESDLPDPNLTDLIGKMGLFTFVNLIQDGAIADYDAKLIKPISMSIDWQGERFTKGAIYEISLVGFSAIPGAQLFSKDQPRHPAGSPAGGQFAPAGGGGDYSSVPGIDKIDIQSTGKFKPTDADLLEEGGVIGEGQIKVDYFSDRTDPELKAEGLADEIFVDVGKATADAIEKDPELLQAALAIHEKNIANYGGSDFFPIPGTDYKVYSDSATPELAGIYTQKEYDSFSLLLRGTMKIDFNELARQALDLSETYEKFGLTLSDQVAKEELMPKLYRLFDAFTTLIREIYEDDSAEATPESKDALIQQAIADLSVGIASRLQVGAGQQFSLSPEDTPPPEDDPAPDPDPNPEEEDMSQVEDLKAQIAELQKTNQLQEAYSALHSKAGALVETGYLKPAVFESDFKAESFAAADIQKKFGQESLDQAIAAIGQKQIELGAIEKFSTPVKMGTRIREELDPDSNQEDAAANEFMESYTFVRKV